MTLKILANPISNVADPDEELILALSAHLQPILSEWQTGKDLIKDIEQLEALLPDLNHQHEKITKGIEKFILKIKVATRDLRIKPVALISLGILAAIGIYFLGHTLAALGTGVVLIVAGVYVLNKINEELFDLQKQKSELESKLSKIKEKIKTILQSIETSKSEIKTRGNSFPDVTIVRTSFIISNKKILGQSTLVDESGILENTNLKTIDLSETQSNLDTIASRLLQLQEVPVLLSIKTKSNLDDAMDTLFGEEDEIQELVYEFTKSLAQVKDKDLMIPLYSNKSALAENFINGKYSLIKYGTSDLKEIRTSAADTLGITSFIAQVNKTKEFGAKVLAELQDTFDNLERVCISYSSARSNSIDTVHEKIFEVLNRASWCSKRFYCPRSIQAPNFLYDVLGVQPMQAHKLNFDQMMFNLSQDKVIAARVKDKPELCDEIFVNYNAIQKITMELEFDDLGDPINSGERPKYIDDQFHEALERFRANLSVLMTGSPNPILNFSRQSELFFDPEVDEWRSSTVPYVYSTSEVLRYGQLLKVTSDLMIPLWEHLWTEKSDFRKSELFRTNESLIRMTEKESEKLIEIANQYRADMRSVRANINLLESDLKSKYDEIIAFRDGMQALGLLSERQKQFLTEEKLQAMTVGERSLIQEGEQYETILGTEPRIQAERRGSAQDPIDLIKSPDILIPYTKNVAMRLAAQ
jgi:prefoldin subunit 5